jgi:hypothetical protein
MGRNALKTYFIRIRDIGKPNPDKFRFVQTGVAGKSLYLIGHLEKEK